LCKRAKPDDAGDGALHSSEPEIAVGRRVAAGQAGQFRVEALETEVQIEPLGVL
jgi:hypothetical protein